MNKKALITGTTGQDASFLIEFLLSKEYEVHGLVRRSSRGYGALENIIHLVKDEKIYRKKLFLYSGDIGDASSIFRIIKDVQPDEIYNLGAQADVQESFYMPEYSIDINGIGVIRMLEAIKQIKPDIKFYQASTSELFGQAHEVPQNEETKFNPQSPYAIGKLVGYHAVKQYRKAYKLFACNGILFNHESEKRGDDYVTRKITKAVSRIKKGLQKELRLGNLEAKRDWGYAGSYIKTMWQILQLDEPDDFVIATGEIHSVKEWMEKCFEYVGLDWKKYVIIDPAFFRPAEVDILQGDYTKAKKTFGYEPEIKFEQLIKIMMDYDLKQAELELLSQSYRQKPHDVSDKQT